MENALIPRTPWAFLLALCLLGPFLFLSRVFIAVAAFPALYLHQGSSDRVQSRLFAWISVPIGALICLLAAKSTPWAISFVLFAGLPGVLLGEFLDWRKDPEWAIAASTTLILLLSLALLLVFISARHIAPLPYFSHVLQDFTNYLIALAQPPTATPGPNDAEVLATLKAMGDPLNAPGNFLSALLLVHIIPTLLLIRWNPKSACRRLGLGRDYLRNYSSPDWLVWPSIACVAFLIFETPYLTIIAMNLAKPLLVIYFFHGMSILAYFLDSFRLRGPIRYILYSVGLVLFPPMVVSCGFFDLWFNFRSRFETTAKP